MQRDMEFIREILLSICEDRFDGTFDRADWSYHLGLLVDQNFITGIAATRVLSGEVVFQQIGTPQLTWKGHDFLDGIRSKTSWERVKSLLSKRGVDLTFDAIKIAGTELIKSQLAAS